MTHTSDGRVDATTAFPAADRSFDGRVDEGTVLSVLGDEDCRAMLSAADAPLTAKELARDCDLPLSTVYRKLDRLEATPLVDVTTRARLHGKHPQQYRRRVDYVQVSLPVQRPVEVSFHPRTDGQ